MYFSRSFTAIVSIIGRTFVVEKPAIDTTGQIISESLGIRWNTMYPTNQARKILDESLIYECLLLLPSLVISYI